MRAFKGFNKDMTCRGFQYEEGKEYETEEASLCKSGFHACEMPLDCLGYYAPGRSEYHEVELQDVTDEKENDSKRVGKKIRIGAKLSIADMVKAQIEIIKENCEEKIEAGDAERATAGNSGAATAGNYGAATAGDSGAATAGNYGAATAGYKGAATAGNYGAATAGYYGAATAGDYGAATAGDKGAATAGDKGAATSRGRSASGEDGLSVVRGNNVRAKGGIGAILVIAEENEDDFKIKKMQVAVVDGKKIKADTWYKINEDGDLVEAPDGEAEE